MTITWRLTVPSASLIWVAENVTSSEIGLLLLFALTFPNFSPGSTKAGKRSLTRRIEIVMACLRTILRDESQTVVESDESPIDPIALLKPTLNPTYLPTQVFMLLWLVNVDFRICCDLKRLLLVVYGFFFLFFSFFEGWENQSSF